MALKANIASRQGIIVVELVGEYTRQQHTAMQPMFERMIEEKWTDRSQPMRLLLDLHGVTGTLSRTGGYFNITREWGDNRNMRIAWLYQDPANEPQFCYREAIARKNGYIARAFRDEDEAMRWLRAGMESV